MLLMSSPSDQGLADSSSCPALSCSSTSFAYPTLSKVRLMQPKEMCWEASVYSQAGQTGVISKAADSQRSTRSRELPAAGSSRAQERLELLVQPRQHIQGKALGLCSLKCSCALLSCTPSCCDICAASTAPAQSKKQNSKQNKADFRYSRDFNLVGLPPTSDHKMLH